ncbi:hypothetical protein FRC12_014549, partial [Ceratobasidium sp. 428]
RRGVCAGECRVASDWSRNDEDEQIDSPVEEDKGTRDGGRKECSSPNWAGFVKGRSGGGLVEKGGFTPSSWQQHIIRPGSRTHYIK